MKSTTIRFADPVYEQLEHASAATGLPINSIVVVACLDWLQKGGAAQASGPWIRTRGARGSWSMLEQTIRLQAEPPRGLRARIPSPLVAQDPLYIFTASAQDALAHAHQDAEKARQWIGTEHLLFGLQAAEEGRAAQVLHRLGVDVVGLRAELSGDGEATPEKGQSLLPTSQLRLALRRAKEEMTREGAAQLGTDHLLLGLLLEGDSQVAEALEARGLTYRAARDALEDTDPEI